MRWTFLIALLFVLELSAAETLQPIIVFDENTTEVGEVELSEFTGSHVQIQRKDLVRNAEPLAAVIADEAGVQFRQAGGLGSYSAVTVRAATAAQTGIFLDGVLLNNAAGGGVDLSQLELLNLTSVDIYRGTSPIQLGVGTIGGAVNLKSHKVNRNAEQESARVLAGSGSFASSRLQFSLQGQQRNWDSILSVSHRASDNDFELLDDNGTPANLQDDRRERRINAEFERSAVLFKIGHDRTASERIDGLVQYTDREQGVPHWRNLSDNEASWATKNLQLQLNRRIEASGDGQWNHTQSLYVNRNNELYDDSLSQIGLGAQRSDTDINITGLRSYWERPGDRGTFALNVDGRVENVTQRDRLDINDFDARRQQLNAAMQYGLFFHDDALLLTPSLRYVVTRDNFSGVRRAGRDQWDSSKATLQLGGKWQSAENWLVFGNVGQHQREPVFFELFGDRGLFVGNEELRAEEGVNADLGVQWYPDEYSRMGVTAFVSLRDELVVTTFNSQGIGRSENTGKARVQGLEIFANRQWSTRLDSSLNLTVQSAENLSTTVAYNGKQLPGEAQLAAHGKLRYTRDRFSAWFETDILQNRFYDLVNALPADDQLLHNFGLSYTTSTWSTTASVRNLGNDIVQDFNDYLKPGRSIQLTFTYQL